MKRLFTRLAALLLFASLLGCQPKSVEPYTMTDSLKQDLTTVQSARIFFGHQSVGGNIMDGVQDLAKESGVRLNIRLSQQQIGSLVGASRESVNKHLNDWQRAGHLAMDGGCIVLRDPALLERIAEVEG